jgi:hypothetical protein
MHPEPVKILMQTVRLSKLLALAPSCIVQNLRIKQQERDKPQQHHHGPKVYKQLLQFRFNQFRLLNHSQEYLLLPPTHQ